MAEPSEISQRLPVSKTRDRLVALGYSRPGGPGRGLRALGLLAVTVIVFWVTAVHMELSLQALFKGLPFLANIISRMFPPNLSTLPDLLKPTLETLEIAFWGTGLAVVLSLPIAFFGARNLSPSPVLYNLTRSIYNFQRGVPELVFAVIFVAAVGLGAFPGVLALAVHAAGVLGKFYADAIENVDPGPIEALQATGATKFQLIAYAVWPQMLPEFVTATLQRFEVNVRAAFVLGLVGAGGLGYELEMAMRLFKYGELLTILLVIFVAVTVIDWISNRVRRLVLG